MNKFTFRISTKRNKKYDAVFDDGRVVSFGAIKRGGTPYDQYHDNTNLKAYSYYNHNDKTRRDSYYKRHGPIDNKKPYSADWFSKTFLWTEW